ncbi:MAG: molybdate ABC transporter substrate-binding protein [Gammaproteobacteria bacterium]|nr:molybdate ABC transporter substrate-binding protein [Gammaproteobacteria bacterium]
MMRKALLTMTMLFPLFWGTGGYADDVPVIAAASDLSYVLVKVSDRFARETGKQLRLSFGSSGNLKRLVEQGAPFEIFMSADEDYVFQLADRGLTIDRGQVYGLGRLVLFAPEGSVLANSPNLEMMPELMVTGEVRKFAIANPRHAPYGRAAREALMNVNLWEKIENSLVFGENAGQAALFAVSGSTQGAIIPHSLALNPSISAKGSFRLIDDTLHSPLRQRMVLLKHAGATARQFYDYLQTVAIRKMMHNYGFTAPGEM